MWEPSHKKGGLGEEGLLSYSPRHFVTPPSEMGASRLPLNGRLRGRKDCALMMLSRGLGADPVRRHERQSRQ